MSAKESHICECISNVDIDPDIVKLDFEWQGKIPQAGQFFLLKCIRSSVFLGRPISVAGWESSSSFTKLSFLIAIKGQGSRELAGLKAGEKAELIGPLGNAWNEAETSLPLTCALVAGGIGIAPLLAIASELNSNPHINYDFYAGFRTNTTAINLLDGLSARELVVSVEQANALHDRLLPASPQQVSDNVAHVRLLPTSPLQQEAKNALHDRLLPGSQHLSENAIHNRLLPAELKQGRITDFFNPAAYDSVFACGPEPMLKAVADMCLSAGVNCYLSMERYMACGVGACLGCTVKTVSGNKCCCTDGPVFDAREVDFGSR